ncbi:pyrimidine-nucleoside phosphorylase [Bacillus piscicola]|uniref:pyrimidine-nucleoside phosphorylase n=1 Tax=Bacillus piscicola TaxID=1632684 RepID=UPI001F09EFDF
MRMVDIITKKRDGEELEESEVRWFIQEYTGGRIPDYQAAAFLMAVYFKGMTQDEAAVLTSAMAASGDCLDLSSIQGVKVDKHSTGGVGDKTTLILGPLVAALDIPVAKMSGRGLGHTGGTIDKLETFAGLRTEFNHQEFVELVNRNKLAVAGQSGNLTPADKKLYALRDVTGTVNSIPLIASSVMSKKIAAGADAIVLDVKYGSGAFMKDTADAKQLAEAMVEIGCSLDRHTVAVISNMDQPLGSFVGNALEVKEAVETLRGEGPADIHELSVELAAHMAVLGGRAADQQEGRCLIEEVMKNGKALAKMKQFIEGQGGDPKLVEQLELLPKAAYEIEVTSTSAGYVKAMHTAAIGRAAMVLGAGRRTLEDRIDHSVGIELHKKIGDYVEEGEPLASLHSNEADVSEVINTVRTAYLFTDTKIAPPPLIFATIH